MKKASLAVLLLVCTVTSACTLTGKETGTASITTTTSLSVTEATASHPLPPKMEQAGPYSHRIMSATSQDGLSWTIDYGVRLEHASVPCAITDDQNIRLYYVDADRGQGMPESVGCAVSTDSLYFTKQSFTIEELSSTKAEDPSIVRDADGKYRLYYLASSVSGDPAFETSPHRINVALSDDGVVFQESGTVFEYPGLVDPDVFIYNGTWFMYVFSRGSTVIATSNDGLHFTYLKPLDLVGWGTVAPIALNDGRLRLYAFKQTMTGGNVVHSFISNDGIKWVEENGDRLAAKEDEQITDPFVVRWRDGYKMYFKVGTRSSTTANVPTSPTTTPLPDTSKPGPWNNDVLIFRVDSSGKATRTAVFERAGVATVTRLNDGRLIAAHQYFPENSPAEFDRVAVHFSSDDGITWTGPQVIKLTGLPNGMRFPFDPTLVPLPDGRIRLYFTSLHGNTFQEDVPAIYSAISINGVDYTFEPGVRFGISGRLVIDCSVVLHQGTFHLYSPDNGPQTTVGAQAKSNPGTGYHAISLDGLHFTRVDDVKIDESRHWLGCAQSNGTTITFWGTFSNSAPSISQTQHGIWSAVSTDGIKWESAPSVQIGIADPGVVRSLDGGWVVLGTGPSRSNVPNPD